MKLYHYTSREHLQQILADMEIKLTASNLLKPVNMHIVNGNLISDTDSYKPVVWFISVCDFKKAKNAGLKGSILDKTEVAIEIDTGIGNFCKWDKWAISNNIDKEWFAVLKATAPLWNTFYISEFPVKVPEKPCVIFRPDIWQRLNQYDY